MQKQRRTIFKFILPVILLVAVSASCSKEKTEDKSSPAYHINQSEKLVIPASVAVPDNLPGGNSRVATYYAEGVQKYKSQPKPGTMPVTYEFVFVAPLADLYDAQNKKVGTHGAGPFWQLSATDSIFAQHYTPAKTSPSPDNSIDWLLLMPKAGKVPTGIFADVLYIQRIATTGGKMPAVLPTGPTETTEVKYTAVYRFTKKNQ